MRSVMKHQFSKAPQVKVPRSTFNRSKGHKLTFDAGYLVPVFLDEALPGDTFKLRTTALCRLATPTTPIMDNIYLDLHFFACPNRLLWNNWKKFCGEQDNPSDSIAYTIPTAPATTGTGYAIGSLHDYMTLPTGIQDYSHNNLPLRMYNRTYNEWYRDENLIDSVTVDLDDGPDDSADYTLLKRGKRHDYFTSCLPWPQKGDNAVTIGLSGNAPVTGIGLLDGQSFSGPSGNVWETDASATTTYAAYQHLGTGSWYGKGESTGVVGAARTPQIYADLSSATGVLINDLRESVQIQRFLEKDARGGTRYNELILSHFGVQAPDYRLQRVEYLGGGSTPIVFNQIAQTSSTDATTPQGNLAAYATGVMKNVGFTKSFVEHSYIMGIASVRADLTYQQGLNKLFSRSTRYDFYYPVFAHLGEQAVLNKELYCQDPATGGSDPENEQVFGYQERWAEYRYGQSTISGQFRSADPNTLDYWHLSQNFASLPVLDQTFIEETPPLDRVLAVTANAPQLLMDMYFDNKCTRPMPIYSVPGLMDHL
jgi:hypothetical protein